MPRLSLWLRWLIAGGAFYVLLLAVCGLYLTTADGQRFVYGPSRAPTAIVEIKYPVFGWPLLASRQNFEHFMNYAFHIPEVCWEGNQVNEFQERQCQDFWYRLSSSAVFVVGPCLLALVLLLLVRSRAYAFYRRACKKIDSKHALYSGKVIDARGLQVRSRRDLFTFLFAVDPVVVQLADRKLERVYVSKGTAGVAPGQTLAVFDGGQVFGAMRPLGVVFHPHVVKISY